MAQPQAVDQGLLFGGKLGDFQILLAGLVAQHRQGAEEGILAGLERAAFGGDDVGLATSFLGGKIDAVLAGDLGQQAGALQGQAVQANLNFIGVKGPDPPRAAGFRYPPR